MVQHASQLLLSLVVRKVRCQSWPYFTLESLLGSYLLSHFTCGVCWTRPPPTKPLRVFFQSALVSVFAYFQLLCRLGERWIFFWVGGTSPRSWTYWRRFLVRYGFPWLWNMEIGPSKVYELFFLFVRDEQTVQSVALLVKAHSTRL